MKKREQSFCSIYQQWVRAGGYKRIQTAPWEAKHSRGKDNIPFAEVPEIERNALLACTTDKGYIFKISDASPTAKGFDGFFFKNSPAYLVFAYTKKFYLISIHNFLHEDKTSKRRSLTEQRANEICILSDSYKMN
jgi:hypothetical protein